MVLELRGLLSQIVLWGFFLKFKWYPSYPFCDQLFALMPDSPLGRGVGGGYVTHPLTVPIGPWGPWNQSCSTVATNPQKTCSGQVCIPILQEIWLLWITFSDYRNQELWGRGKQNSTVQKIQALHWRRSGTWHLTKTKEGSRGTLRFPSPILLSPGLLIP